MKQQIIDSSSLIIFDLDGTLVRSRCRIEPNIREALTQLADLCDLAVISGQSLEQMRQQISPNLPEESPFTIILPESGNIAFKKGQLLWQELIKEELLTTARNHIDDLLRAFSQSMEKPHVEIRQC